MWKNIFPDIIYCCFIYFGTQSPLNSYNFYKSNIKVIRLQ